MSRGTLFIRNQDQRRALTPSEPQSRFGETLLEIWLVCPQNGTAVLKGLKLGIPVCVHTNFRL